MTEGLKRYFGRGHLHFLTFSCCRRLPLLGAAPARDAFVRELVRARGEYAFILAGYVVMPEHVHLLVGEPRRSDLSVVLKMLKQRVSRELRGKGLGERGGEHLPRFWEPRFYDFNVFSEQKRREKLLYMHANLVKRGLVNHPRDWAWSSWSCYECGEPGLISVDLV